MSKDEKKAAELKAVEVEAAPVENTEEQEKTEKVRKIFGYEIRKAEKTPKAKKVKLTKEEKKAKREAAWAKNKNKILAGAIFGGAILGGLAKTYIDSKYDHPTDDEAFEDDTVCQLGPGETEWTKDSPIETSEETAEASGADENPSNAN
jgi:hypothetical protein